MVKLVLKEKKKLKEDTIPQYKTYGDLKKIINGIINKERLSAVGDKALGTAVDQILGLIPGASNAKSAFDVVKSVYTATDDKKTKTFLDKINVDDQYSKMIDNKVEMAFLKDLVKKILEDIKNKPEDTPLPDDFNVNARLQAFLKDNFKNRTLVGGKGPPDF